MYRLADNLGDSVAVPQLLFSRLEAAGGGEGRFRVALYLVQHRQATAAAIARALHLKKEEVDAALSYWEGAGLLEGRAVLPPVQEAAPEKRPRMTTAQVVQAGRENATLGRLLDELQRLYGAVIGESDINLYATLYTQDGFAPEMILMAGCLAVKNNARRARYVEKVLQNWQANGINDAAAADAHMKLLEQREENERLLAGAMGLQGDPFTLADKKKIALWFEDYGYGMEMIEAARRVAGEKRNDVKYLAGILKQWQAKGYRTVRQVNSGDENHNLRNFRQTPAAGKNPMNEAARYTPMKKRSSP